MPAGVPSRNVRTKEFKELYDRLPESIQGLAVDAFLLSCENPAHRGLHLHELDDIHKGKHRAGSKSVWITRRYRAIYVEEPGINVWYWVGTHSDYNIFTGRK
jgi:hypothetical protein